MAMDGPADYIAQGIFQLHLWKILCAVLYFVYQAKVVDLRYTLCARPRGLTYAILSVPRQGG